LTEQAENYLCRPALARLWSSAREAYERNGGLAGQAVVRDLSADEATELSGLLRRRRPLQPGGQLRVDLATLDATLREFADPLEQWLEALGGKLTSRPVQREQARTREAALWAALEGQAAAADARLGRVVDDLRQRGLLKRLAGGAQLELGRQALDLTAYLLAADGETIDIAVLAASRCGDAKALNEGRPLATLVLRALALLAEQPVPRDAQGRRELWERYGVICDPLSSHVLLLNLPVTPDGIGAAVAAHRELGEPLRLTLRALSRFPLRFLPGSTVHVCENPSVVSAAAEARGAACAPLVCTDGRPVVAVQKLLTQAAAGGCQIRYHGDFDWPGVAMAAEAIRRYNAEPWRLSAGDYVRALRAGAPTKPLKGRPEPTAWDPQLARAMAACGLMVEEEAVIGDLLEDLAA
jgi:uncharacterized protein (TIGR02679 family)